jgi:hypothetical protein
MERPEVKTKQTKIYRPPIVLDKLLLGCMMWPVVNQPQYPVLLGCYRIEKNRLSIVIAVVIVITIIIVVITITIRVVP